MSALSEQINAAREEVFKMKNCAPYLFPQWQRLQNAIAAKERADAELAAAQKEWDDL